MRSKPTPLPRFLPLESFFMRLPSSSSLLLASLAVSSSSSSSLSALAAPAGDGPVAESLSSLAPVPQGSDDTVAQPNSAPTSCTITFLSNTATGYPQARNVVDKVTAPLPVPPELVKPIPDLIQAIVGPLIGKNAPKAREEPLDVVKRLVPAGK